MQIIKHNAGLQAGGGRRMSDASDSTNLTLETPCQNPTNNTPNGHRNGTLATTLPEAGASPNLGSDNCLNTTFYKACSGAVRHFLYHTKLRKCPKRTRLVERIQQSARPKREAERLLTKFGRRDISVHVDVFNRDLNCLEARVGPFDPVFARRITLAKKACCEGLWTKAEHKELLKVLRSAWCPWSRDERNAHRSELRGVLGRRWRQYSRTSSDQS